VTARNVQLGPAHHLVLGYLYHEARGAEEAKSYPQIVARLAPLAEAIGAGGLTPRGIYQIMADIQLAGWPVGTTPGRPPGAFVCVSRRDWRIGGRNLYGRLRLIARRYRRYRRTFREAAGGQTTFDWTAADRALASARDALARADPGADAGDYRFDSSGQGRLLDTAPLAHG